MAAAPLVPEDDVPASHQVLPAAAAIAA